MPLEDQANLWQLLTCSGGLESWQRDVFFPPIQWMFCFEKSLVKKAFSWNNMNDIRKNSWKSIHWSELSSYNWAPSKASQSNQVGVNQKYCKRGRWPDWTPGVSLGNCASSSSTKVNVLGRVAVVGTRRFDQRNIRIEGRDSFTSVEHIHPSSKEQRSKHLCSSPCTGWLVKLFITARGSLQS